MKEYEMTEKLPFEWCFGKSKLSPLISKRSIWKRMDVGIINPLKSKK